MDEYLRCLYEHATDRLLTDARLDAAKYHRRSIVQNQAWNALKAALTPEQMKLVQNYQFAQANVCALEDELLFEAAVSLGKWMARA